ncbi:MAG: hypothetical protein IAC58_03085 [Firmicutes bacterium]|uniref:Uncharacterized protein n=1 Tax=Candidatus Onthovivens merdipullorum TaxID=2840889 RepID=A0A9D9GX53_9BACL|nr:hypothetical protein [Candidatus Onthovivens merdipullorum]
MVNFISNNSKSIDYEKIYYELSNNERKIMQNIKSDESLKVSDINTFSSSYFGVYRRRLI